MQMAIQRTPIYHRNFATPITIESSENQDIAMKLILLSPTPSSDLTPVEKIPSHIQADRSDSTGQEAQTATYSHQQKNEEISQLLW